MFTVQIKLILQNHILVFIQRGTDESLYVLLENTHRPAELLKDFPHLYPNSYQSQEEFQADNSNFNLIKLTLFPDFATDTVNPEMLSDFEYMASSLVEHYPQTDHAIVWQEDNQLTNIYDTYDDAKEVEWRRSLHQYLLSFAENAPVSDWDPLFFE